MKELASFSEELVTKPMIVVGAKLDAMQQPERRQALEHLAHMRELPFHAISSVTGEGIEELKFAMAGIALAGGG